MIPTIPAVSCHGGEDFAESSRALFGVAETVNLVVFAHQPFHQVRAVLSVRSRDEDRLGVVVGTHKTQLTAISD
jgi:cytochrome c peroxidase